MPRPLCARCQRPLSTCFCARLPWLAHQWPVTILQHPEEVTHALGTARIAALGLQHCRLLPASGGEVVSAVLAHKPPPVLIYPGAQARPVAELAQHRAAGEVTLLFVDASWRKSRRLLHEHPALAALPRYQLDDPPASRYRIRREPAAGAVSTLEAIVLSLQQLEAADFDAAPLLAVMDWMVDQQIRHMAAAVYRRNYNGERD